MFFRYKVLSKVCWILKNSDVTSQGNKETPIFYNILLVYKTIMCIMMWQLKDVERGPLMKFWQLIIYHSPVRTSELLMMNGESAYIFNRHICNLETAILNWIKQISIKKQYSAQKVLYWYNMTSKDSIHSTTIHANALYSYEWRVLTRHSHQN